ncbi:hypothetical protein ACA910_010858 [Epithemia clementina (nom. ined.)]
MANRTTSTTTAATACNEEERNAMTKNELHFSASNRNENITSIEEDAVGSPQEAQHPQFKLTVAYNGYRFNGFQKQPPQHRGGGGQHHKQGSLDDDSVMRPPPKRPHWESQTGRMKRVPNTIQDCLEQALLNYVHHFLEQQQQQTLPSASLEESKEKIAKKKGKKSAPSTEQLASCIFTLDDLMFEFAGRTDKGVHALGQVITCRLPIPVDQQATATSANFKKGMLQGINSRLPDDISVSYIEGPLSPALDPRYDAVLKQYSYTIKYHRVRKDNNNQTPSAFTGGVHTMRHALLDSPCLWLVPWPIDDSIFPTICQALSGTHDYTQFAHKDVRNQYDNFLMTIDFSFEQLSFQPTPCGGEIVMAKFLARSKGFRRTMVRNLVGFCIRLAATTRIARFNSSTESHFTTVKTDQDKQRDSMLVPPVATAGVEAGASTVEGNTTLWKEHVEPNQQLIEAAAASGLCLDYVQYVDGTNGKTKF